MSRVNTNPNHPNHPKQEWRCPKCNSDFTQRRILGDDYICMYFRHIFTYDEVKYQLSPVYMFYDELFKFIWDLRKSSRSDEFKHTSNVAAYIEAEMKRLFDKYGLEELAKEQLIYTVIKPMLESDTPKWNVCYGDERGHPIRNVRDVINNVKRCPTCDMVHEQ